MKKPQNHQETTARINGLIAERDQWQARATKEATRAYDLEIDRDHLLEVANKFISMCDIYFINGDFTKDTTNQVLELRALALTAVSRVKK